MSFDPFASGPEVPPEYSPAAQPTSDATAVRQRVQPPAIGLIVIGVLNLVLAVFPALEGIVYANMTPEQMEDLFRQQNPQVLQDMKTQGWSMSDVRKVVVNGALSWAVVDFLASFLVIVGGIRMIVLRNYGLAILASIVAAIPGVSCSGCCGLGAIVGIWSIVVLINPEVRGAFH